MLARGFCLPLVLLGYIFFVLQMEGFVNWKWDVIAIPIYGMPVDLFSSYPASSALCNRSIQLVSLWMDDMDYLQGLSRQIRSLVHVCRSGSAHPSNQNADTQRR